MEISLSQVWDVSLHVCAAVFVFAMWRRVSGSDWTAVKVQDGTAFSSFDTFSPTGCIDLATPVTSPLAAVECGRGYVCVCAFTCIWTDTTRSYRWGSSGRGVKAFSLSTLAFFYSSLLLTECQCWMLCSRPPIDKIRTTCSSYLLARESQADLLTHAPHSSPPLSCLSLMSGKWKVVPWQFALDSLPEGVCFKRSGPFPFSLICIFHLCVH